MATTNANRPGASRAVQEDAHKTVTKEETSRLRRKGKPGAPWCFGLNAGRLTAADFDPIPISRPGDPDKDSGKRPAQGSGWQHGCAVDEWHRFADCGVGLLTARTPTIDIDTHDQALGDALQELVDRHLGEAPIRYGQAPERALPFRLQGEPYGKVQLAWRPIAGTADEGRPKPPGLEVQAAGQQVVVLGVHPVTREPYRWERDPDLSIPRSLLPPLDQARARRFMQVAARFIQELGGELITGAGLAEQPRPRRPAARPESQAPDRDRVLHALERIGNADMHYDDWIRTGLALKAALGEGGRDLWLWWSALSAKNDPQVTERKWQSFRPTTIGAGTLFLMARER